MARCIQLSGRGVFIHTIYKLYLRVAIKGGAVDKQKGVFGVQLNPGFPAAAKREEDKPNTLESVKGQ